MHKYKTGNYKQGKSTAEEELFYHRLHMNQQYVTVAKKKANLILGCIKWNFMQDAGRRNFSGSF